MWSEELRKMTIEHFGDFGAAMLKSCSENNQFAIGFDRNLYISDRALSLIPDTEKEKRYFIFAIDKYMQPVSFIKAYDLIEELVEDGWALD